MILLGSQSGGAGFAIAARLLNEGAPILDVIEVAIRAVELDPTEDSVGLGGLPNAADVVELDAGIMDGATLKSGAVGALIGCRHPITVARRVMAMTHHELLVGAGARAFARETVPEDLEAARDGIASFEPLLGKSRAAVERLRSHDTVITIGCDARGDFGAGASTSGLAGKYPGRLGDSCIVGAGFFAENHVGAVGCTGIGEMTMRCSTARQVIESLRGGHPVEAAVGAALQRLKALEHGLIGAVTVAAIDRACRYAVGTLRGQSSHYYVFDGTEDSGPMRSAFLVF